MFWLGTHAYLEAEFDEPDVAADHELCRAIAAGRLGLHPDGWGNYEPMRIKAAPPDPDLGQDMPIDPEWEAKHRRRPVEEPKPPPRPRGRPRKRPLTPRWMPSPPAYAGELQLTCDECGREAFGTTLKYTTGQREAMVVGLRALGREDGWTCIANRDYCPRCTRLLRLQLAAPEAVGNGAGAGEGHKQHADGG